MNFETFEQHVIPACRTKHLFLTNPIARLKRMLTLSVGNTHNKAPFHLGEPLIPHNFVRLEPWEMEYLYMLASRSKAGIVETGRFNGGSVLLMACANSSVPIYSIDIAPQNDAQLHHLLEKLNVGKNISLLLGDSQKTKYPQVGNIDLLFVDGDHSFDGCLNDLRNWYDNLLNGGHVVLHDCHYGSEVQEAVLEFVKSKSVEIIASPYKIKSHFRYPDGSFCHFIKRG